MAYEERTNINRRPMAGRTLGDIPPSPLSDAGRAYQATAIPHAIKRRSGLPEFAGCERGCQPGRSGRWIWCPLLREGRRTRCDVIIVAGGGSAGCVPTLRLGVHGASRRAEGLTVRQCGGDWVPLRQHLTASDEWMYLKLVTRLIAPGWQKGIPSRDRGGPRLPHCSPRCVNPKMAFDSQSGGRVLRCRAAMPEVAERSTAVSRPLDPISPTQAVVAG